MRLKLKITLLLFAFITVSSPALATDSGMSGSNGQEPPWLRSGFFEIGARYWYSAGQTDFDLYDSTGGILVSRLTYDGLDAHSGEIFFLAQHATGIFVKGYGGLGFIPCGSLNDEDFPPVIAPYSSTLSSQDGGDISYFNIDIGYAFLVANNEAARFQLAGFTGYHYWNETVHAFGCTQIATNPAVCVPTIAQSTRVISNEVKWNSWRVGVMGTVEAGNGLKLTGEAAWVPYTELDNTDNHHLRPLINPLPSDGNGSGLQLEAVLSYDITDDISIGAGARYWRLGRTDGHAHFEQTPGGGVSQVVKFQSERYGGFIQVSVKLY